MPPPHQPAVEPAVVRYTAAFCAHFGFTLSSASAAALLPVARTMEGVLPEFAWRVRHVSSPDGLRALRGAYLEGTRDLPAGEVADLLGMPVWRTAPPRFAELVRYTSDGSVTVDLVTCVTRPSPAGADAVREAMREVAAVRDAVFAASVTVGSDPAPVRRLLSGIREWDRLRTVVRQAFDAHDVLRAVPALDSSTWPGVLDFRDYSDYFLVSAPGLGTAAEPALHTEAAALVNVPTSDVARRCEPDGGLLLLASGWDGSVAVAECEEAATAVVELWRHAYLAWADLSRVQRISRSIWQEEFAVLTSREQHGTDSQMAWIVALKAFVNLRLYDTRPSSICDWQHEEDALSRAWTAYDGPRLARETKEDLDRLESHLAYLLSSRAGAQGRRSNRILMVISVASLIAGLAQILDYVLPGSHPAHPLKLACFAVLSAAAVLVTVVHLRERPAPS